MSVKYKYIIWKSDNFLLASKTNRSVRISNIRAGLRMLEENSIRIAALKSEIEEGLNSGEAVDFDPAEHLKSLKAAKRNA